MINEALPLIFAWAAGVGLGAFFFGGLWWTLRRGMSSKRPALWFFASLLVRMSILLSGMFFVAGGHWERMVVSLVGCIMARQLLMWLTPSLRRESTRPEEEKSHAAHS